MPGKNRIIMAGGGTGGHIFPAIAIANAIKEKLPQAEFLFVGAKGKMEMEKVPEAGYKIKGLTISGYNRSSLIKNLSLPFKLLKSFFEVAGIFRDFKPDAVIGVGGYSSYPVLRYAQSRGIPSFIHESNSFAGKSNIMLGKKATRIFTAFEGMEKFFPEEKIIISGNPVRKNIATPVPLSTALSHFGLKEGRQTVLVVGGSLGAKSINEAILKDLEMIERQNLQLIWQTGKPFYEKALSGTRGKDRIRVFDFIGRMDLAYRAADVVISRSGAMAVSELCTAGCAAIFVPFPHAAEDHQTFNAMQLVNRQAAWIVKDHEAAEQLVPMLIHLLNDVNLKDQFRENIKSLAVDNADEVIAKQIIEDIN